MTDHTLARADEVLTELVELVETARTLPMSSSCVIPRERTLDLLDALREVLPPEMIEARRLVAQRDQVLSEANTRAERTIADANDTAERRLAESTAEADQRVQDARNEAHQTIEAARAEQERLTSAATVQQAAVAAAERTKAEADEQAETTRAQAGRYAEKLTTDAHGYAAHTLAGLVDTLQRLLATAENGRDALTGTTQPSVTEAAPEADADGPSATDEPAE